MSSSSSPPPSPTSTGTSFLSSSNSENLNPTANLNLNDSLTQTTTTIDDYSLLSSGTEGSDDGNYENHLGLNPSSERIVELQSDKHEIWGELMINRSPQDVLVAAETVAVASVDSSPSPMIGPPPPQPPLPRTNRDSMFDMDRLATWLSDQLNSIFMHSMHNDGISLSLPETCDCVVCGKRFRSFLIKKELLVHMNLYPGREWRGMYPPPIEARVVT